MLWGRRGGDGDPTEQERRMEREEGTDRFPGAGRPGGQRGSLNPFLRYKSVLDLELTSWKIQSLMFKSVSSFSVGSL